MDNSGCCSQGNSPSPSADFWKRLFVFAVFDQCYNYKMRIVKAEYSRKEQITRLNIKEYFNSWYFPDLFQELHPYLALGRNAATYHVKCIYIQG